MDPLYCDDDTLKEDSSLSLYYRVFRKSLELSGLDPGLSAEGLMQVLREAGEFLRYLSWGVILRLWNSVSEGIY